MSVTDPIADMLTVLRNAIRAKKRWAVVPASNLKRSLLDVLAREKFIRTYEEMEVDGHPAIKVYLKYHRSESVLRNLQRVSKPGRRVYIQKDEIPRVYGGLGTAVISTSAGIRTDKEARKQGLGGEWVCNVW
jgi:small subunit ribosomal protein S8